MNDSAQQFHPGSQPEFGNGIFIGNGTGAGPTGSGEGEVERWHEPGDAGDGSWEEPQWDEPQEAEPSFGRSTERLTPGQLRSVVFRRAPLGKRGLDEHQVNSLLDRVEEELARLTQEKNALAGELELLRGYVAEATEIAPAALPQAQEPEAGVVSRESGLTRVVKPEGPAESQTMASRMHEVHVYSASLLSQAQQTADQYIQDAQRYSRELVEDARRKRSEMLSSAHSEHGTPGDESWEREAVRLRATSRAYRGKLRDYFELLLMNLDEWETAEDIGAAQQSNEMPPY